MSERSSQEKRLLFVASFGLLFLILFVRTFYLQVATYQKHQDTAESIRAKVIPSLAPRGIIFDRNGVVMATSRPYFSLYLLPEQMSHPEKSYEFLKKYDLINAKQWALAKQAYSIRDVQPILLKENLRASQVAFLKELEQVRPELAVAARNIRYYPAGNVAGHVLGHIGEITLKQLLDKTRTGYRVGDIIGLAGIEKVYDVILRGINGGQQIEVNAFGQTIRRLDQIQDVPGSDVQLTLDMRLQARAQQLLGANRGAVLLLNPHNGEVLTAYSNPSFDPNFFTTPITPERWVNFIAKENPLHNRALTAYPAGSTFKISNFLASLSNLHVQSQRPFFCKGYLQWGSRVAQCWMAGGHGKVDFFHGLVHSCNVVFYTLGLELGAKSMAAMAQQLSFGARTGIDLPEESAGFVPTEAWKQQKFGQAWYPGDSMNMAIGQGWVQVTPLQLAVATSALVTSQNILYQPHLLKVAYANRPRNRQNTSRKVLGKLNVESKHVELLKQSMRKVVEEGTGRGALVPNLAIAGKTGTAEDPPRTMPHAWFTAFAPYESPQVVVTVFIQQGGHGGDRAAAVARDLLLYWQELYRP